MVRCLSNLWHDSLRMTSGNPGWENQPPEQRRLVRSQCTLDGVGMIGDESGRPISLATHGGRDVAWLPTFFDKNVEMSTAKKVGMGVGCGIVGLLIIL